MKIMEKTAENCINQLRRVNVGKEESARLGCTPSTCSSRAQPFTALLAIKSAAPHLRGKLTKMMNSLNWNLTHGDTGHGTLRSAPSSSPQHHARLPDIRFIACRFNGCINTTKGLQRA